MNKKILFSVLFLVIIAIVWLLFVKEDVVLPTTNIDDGKSELIEISTDTEAVVGPIERLPSSPDRKVYVNQEWRFSFEYPVQWELKERTFENAASIFNISIWPTEEKANFPDPVLVNITPEWWVSRLLPEIEEQENAPATSSVDGQTAVIAKFVSHSVIDSVQYFVLVNNEYWYSISGKIGAGNVTGYAKELEMVRSSFKFHEPLPRLGDLDVEPYIPDYVGETQ